MNRIVWTLVLIFPLLPILGVLAESTSPSEQLAGLEKELADAPNNPDLLLSAGRLCLDSGNYEKAKRFIGRAIAVDSTHAMAFALLGLAATVELREGYDEKIEGDTNYRTNLIFATLEPMSKAVALAPDDLEIRLMRGIASVEMPVFGGYWHRFRGDMARTITDEMVENGYGGFLDYAVEDLHTVIAGAASEDMKAQAYYYLGLAYRIKGLQYWQTLTKVYPGTGASKRAWAQMKPEEGWIDPPSSAQPRVSVRFHIGLETDLPPQTGVWIEDGSGNFVKNLYVSGFSAYVKRTQVVLPQWVRASAFETDATTGASISAGRHRFVWDLTATSGIRARDGRYTVKIEVHHWPSMQYQLVGAEIEIGGGAKTTVVREGDLVPFVEVKYVPE